MMKAHNITNARFGRLVAIRREPRRLRGRMRSYWLCQCDCGATTSVVVDTLLSGATTSCGCFQREGATKRRTTHGRSKSKIYRSWGGMIYRCTNKNSPAFHNYGGRGITVCAAWLASFEAFAEDVGLPPSSKHSIDRWPNKNGNYEPGNVRWATPKEQALNRRGLHEVNIDGDIVCLKEAAARAGIRYATVHQRIVRHQWAVADALSITPVMGHKPARSRRRSGLARL